jgi:hypothetical protein
MLFVNSVCPPFSLSLMLDPGNLKIVVNTDCYIQLLFSVNDGAANKLEPLS